MKNNRLVIIGCRGHGRVTADVARLCGYENILFLDDIYPEQPHSCNVVGLVKDYSEYVDSFTDFIVATGDASYRADVTEKLISAGAMVVSLVHPSAVIGTEVTIGSGVIIMAGAVINTGSVIGDGVIVNTCASVDHDCCLGDYVHVAVGAHLCGNVTVGERSWIGAGSTVINAIDICSGCMIGAGAVVISSIDVSGTYVGIPARIME